MSTFLGDFACKADSKGRIVVPSAFKKVLNAMEEKCLVAKKDLFEDCINLIPHKEWEKEMESLRTKVNMYNKQQAAFFNQYLRGVAEINIDANGRILLPKRLIERISDSRNMVMVGVDVKIQLWSEEVYNQTQMPEEELARMADFILGGNSDE